MSADERFFDTSVLLYLISADTLKAERAEEVLRGGGVVSLQVLGEFASVARRKSRMSWEEIGDALDVIRGVCRTEPVTEEVLDAALGLAARYDFSWYDAMIVASAQLAGCTTLYAEDMHSGLRIGRRLTIRNPFLGG